MSAVDLSAFADGLGPRAAEALHEELRVMAQTRELALRRQVELELKVEGLERALAMVCFAHGTDDGHGKRALMVPGEIAAEAAARAVALSTDVDEYGLHVVLTVTMPGEWKIGGKPSEQELALLPVHEDPPVVTDSRVNAGKVIVKTKRGLRVARWVPALD